MIGNYAAREYSKEFQYTINVQTALLAYNENHNTVSPMQLLFGSLLCNITGVHTAKGLIAIDLHDVYTSSDSTILVALDSPIAQELKQRLGI